MPGTPVGGGGTGSTSTTGMMAAGGQLASIAAAAGTDGPPQQQHSQRSLGGVAAAATAALSGDAPIGAAPGPATAQPRLGFMSGHVLGTPSHLAPEAFLPGNLLGGSVDIYSFGMLMWEVLVGIPALAGLSAARVHSYTSMGLRPQFPPNIPDHYRNLAHLRWAQDPRKRPTASALVTSLPVMLSAVVPRVCAWPCSQLV